MSGAPSRQCSAHVGWSNRGYLPHYDAPGAVQHVVFRLSDSLPVEVLRRVETASPRDRLAAAEAALDSGLGHRALADPRIAERVERALLHFDAQRYGLIAWCVMPTHVHVLASQPDGWPLAKIIHAWKSFTANTGNRVLGAHGRFWAPDYFDRAIRDEEQLATVAAYIETNPVTAGLCSEPGDWPWSSARRRGLRSAGFQPAS